MRKLPLLLLAMLSLTFIAHASEPTQPLQAALDSARKANQVSAMQMTIIMPNKDPITINSGKTLKSGGTKITDDTLFQIGSDTKSFTAALLVKLEGEGKLKLTDSVTKYLPQYPQWKNITLSQLLHNNSGIPSYSEDKDFQKEIAEHPKYQWQPAELVAIAAKKQADFLPGKGWHYSNTNFILAGMIAEKVTGQPLNSLYKSYFLDKSALNLAHTYYIPSTYSAAFLKRMAHGYNDKSEDVMNVDMSWAGAAGAMISNSSDLAAWSYDLFHHKALTDAQTKKMMELVSVKTGEPVSKEDKEGYGMGIGMRVSDKYGPWFGHEGETLGFHAIFVWFVEQDITVAIIANGEAPALRDFAVSVPGLVK